MSLSNKVVLITGASSGIGAAAAILFAKEGADVAMVGRNQTKLEAVAKKISDSGKKPLIINADISKDHEVERIISETVAEFGKLDVLVNNAGFASNGTILDGKILETYDEIMNVNVRAVIHLTTLATPHLKATNGNIVNVSSAAALTTPIKPEFLSYYISKAALDHFTRGAALELAPLGIRVNSVNPGPVITDFFENVNRESPWENLQKLTALNRVSEPEEIADLILYLASEKAKGVTGSIFVADNGTLLKKGQNN